MPSFADSQLHDWLHASSTQAIDALPFGVVGMVPDGIVAIYNKAESSIAGLTPDRVIGRHFFSSVAPCTNNHMVAGRFDSEPEIDDTIDYVFTLRMRSTPVRLRLLKHPGCQYMYLAVERR
ncbi:Phosphonate transporter [Rhodovastum atsumiense]|uniref:Phosphonate transporter n=1 Tax=Rhodovastum atsumiense TaxID=504468 RepID=A0A5M6IUE8_9PROT|nr:phosphonate transporter [Rhodovastum atsumiense]KAA5611168.1 phosphonate transporter [Rhodovastum atsumiense]CAH2602526.1 Phosphonate transporter [Rhodovastum atsumiense]